VRTLRILCALVVVAGGCLTGRALYLHAKTELAGILIRRAWEQGVQSGKPRAPWPWADTHPIARLQIPRLGYDEIVLEGATPRTLAFGPARLLSGANLGEPGNLLLAGHRTSWFRPLEQIVQGDEIHIEWSGVHAHELQKRTYRVDMIRVVEPQDTSLLAPTSEDSLTLITCYPFGHGPSSPQRYVVRASPIGSSQRSHSKQRQARIESSSFLRDQFSAAWTKAITNGCGFLAVDESCG
jgi:sortase A